MNRNIRIITVKMLEGYRDYLFREEKSGRTIDKYIRDLSKLMCYADGREITKELMINYKENLVKCNQYEISSINTFIVAANRFFEYMGWYGINVKTIKKQNESFCPEDRELTRLEYNRLMKAAVKKKDKRTAMIIQTLCATGIRVSELASVTVKAVYRGELEVNNKGKVRKVLIPAALRKQLMVYISQKHIKKGSIFQTRTGRPVNRSNVWRDMKALCGKAGVKESKVFPHNLRHLFARTYYGVIKDIAKLADILGHSSIETTRIYLRTSSREHMKQLEQMGLVMEI